MNINKNNDMMTSEEYRAMATPLVERIIRELGLTTKIADSGHMLHHVQAETVTVHGVKIGIKLFQYGQSINSTKPKPDSELTSEAEIEFVLPKTAVLANTYMDHVAAKEGLKKNNYYHYYAGPKYRDQAAERNYKNTDIGAYHRCRHGCKYCYAK